MTKRITVVLAALLVAATAHAQERVESSNRPQSYRAGWTITPTLGFAETYDDNISLFGKNTAENQNDDVIATFFPALDLHYSGKHTRFGSSYSGSFLNYRTFSLLNRWDQRMRIELRRQETARLNWFARAAASMLPSTDLVELGGLPYRHTGAKTADGRGGVEYTFNAHDSFTSSVNFQHVEFDRPPDVRAILRGGDVLESLNIWRHKIDARLAFGTDYSFRRAHVVGDLETFNIHTAEGAVDYDLSPSWSFSGGAGAVYLESTAVTSARTGPAWRISLERHRGASAFHVGYSRSYIPSFGFGGTIQNDEVGLGFHAPLFGSRHFYTENSIIYRDNQPLTDLVQQLPLRSLRTYSVVGWEPQRWVRLEGFYSRVQQTSLRAGGQLYRNRVGIQIVTSKPVRVQ
jgi:hypothetical protein